AGSPSEQVLGDKFVCCPQGIQSQFPEDRWLAELKAESFSGSPLFDAAGRATGLMAVMNRKPLLNSELTKSMLKIYSVRAASELERKRAEQALRQQLDRISLLNQITRAIAERQGMESNFKVTLDFLEERLAIDFSRVYSWDPAGQDLTLVARGQKGLPLASEIGILEDTKVAVAHSGLQGCLSGQLVYQPDVRRDPAPLSRLLA